MKKILFGIAIVVVWVLIFLNEMSCPAFAMDQETTCKVLAQVIAHDINATHMLSGKTKNLSENVYHIKRIQRARFWLEIYRDLDCDITLITDKAL